MTMKKVMINSLCFLGVWKKIQMSCFFCIYFFFSISFFFFVSWMVPIVVAHMLLHLLANLQEKSLVAQHPYTTTRMHSSVLVWSNCMLFFGLLPLYALLGVDMVRRGWKSCSGE